MQHYLYYVVLIFTLALVLITQPTLLELTYISTIN